MNIKDLTKHKTYPAYLTEEVLLWEYRQEYSLTDIQPSPYVYNICIKHQFKSAYVQLWFISNLSSNLSKTNN